jgi:hypothetical protein
MGVIRMKKHFVISVATLLASLDASAAVPKKVNPFAGGERLVYTRVVEAYRKSDLGSVIQTESAKR